MAHLLAHQGGWDELLWFAAPIVAVILWVRWAGMHARSRRATHSRATSESASASGEGAETGSTLPAHDRDH